MTARHPDHAVDPQFPNRWSPRSFAQDSLTQAQVMQLLEAARWAPSASNHQPWRFAWGLRGDPAFAAIHDGLMGFNTVWAGRAAALIVIFLIQHVPAGDGHGQPARDPQGFKRNTKKPEDRRTEE